MPPIMEKCVETIRRSAETLTSEEMTHLANLCTALSEVSAPEPLDPPKPWREHPRRLALLDAAVASWRANPGGE